MSNVTNQLHGKTIEDRVKSVYPGALEHKSSITAHFDIEGAFDHEYSLPTSVKTSKSDIIELADSRRFFANKESFRLLVFKYKQVSENKVINDVYEYLIDNKTLEKIKGNLNYETVENFHNDLLSYKTGEHVIARKYAREHNKALKQRYNSGIILNPKIDSKNQRRLQCSVKLSTLNEIVPEESKKHYNDNYKGLSLPILIESGPRKFRTRKE